MTNTKRLKTASDLLAEHVARALALRRLTAGKYPTEAILKRVDEEWPDHLEDALVAIGAMGEALKVLSKK